MPSERVTAIVNYHYCRPGGSGLKGIQPEMLDRHLEALGRHFRFGTMSQLLDASDGADGPLAVITFDDGVKDFVEHAVPVLNRHGVRATCYVSSLPLRERRLLAVHRTHMLLAQVGAGRLLAAVDAELRRYGTLERDNPERLGISALYKHDTPEARQVKRLLNYELPVAVADEILGRVFDTILGSEAQIAERFYLSSADIARCAADGHEIGVHTDTHPVMSRLAPYQQQLEIERCAQAVGAITGQNRFTLAYPYGVPGTFTDDTIGIVSQLDSLTGAVTLDRRVAAPADLTARYRIPRFDNTDVFEADGRFRRSFTEACLTEAIA